MTGAVDQLEGKHLEINDYTLQTITNDHDHILFLHDMLMVCHQGLQKRIDSIVKEPAMMMLLLSAHLVYEGIIAQRWWW